MRLADALVKTPVVFEYNLKISLAFSKRSVWEESPFLRKG